MILLSLKFVVVDEDLSHTCEGYHTHEELYEGEGSDFMHLQGKRWAASIFEWQDSIYQSATTFSSYGASYANRNELLQNMPDSHIEFLRNMDYIYDFNSSELGRVICVHAGLEDTSDIEEYITKLKTKDDSAARLQALCGRSNVLPIPLELQQQEAWVVSGHHHRFVVNGKSRRLVIDECGGADNSPLSCVIMMKDFLLPSQVDSIINPTSCRVSYVGELQSPDQSVTLLRVSESDDWTSETGAFPPLLSPMPSFDDNDTRHSAAGGDRPSSLIRSKSSVSTRRKYLLVVVCVNSGDSEQHLCVEESVKHAHVACKNGADGIILMGDGANADILLAAYEAIRGHYDEIFIGINFMTSMDTAFYTIPHDADAIWTLQGVDSNGVHPDITRCKVSDIKVSRRWLKAHFGGFLMETSIQDFSSDDFYLNELVDEASKHLDVCVISELRGDSVSTTADRLKFIHTMMDGSLPLALVTTISAECIDMYLPYVNYVIFGTIPIEGVTAVENQSNNAAAIALMAEKIHSFFA
eukprot:CAMPEP_0185036166 /NCGR_PEP_ID=MMETSP1103-20130426/28730_1 /TAXON_ID=36769 /ORGANISM="Paraphysomonas bandaiensis, Strain Caron Lab Isolate" /LENGTH=524 /DNA_ID=CAMNT_0027573595 /DNA_START=291 /DNA_END=1864 /DNA_ORIENTATION=+